MKWPIGRFSNVCRFKFALTSRLHLEENSRAPGSAYAAVPPLPCYHGRLLRFSLVAAVQALLYFSLGNFSSAPLTRLWKLAVVLAVYIFAMTGLGLF